MSEQTQIALMTAPEFRERMQEDPVIILPLGSIEQHGPACPMGDFRLTEALANDVAKKKHCLVAPTLPFGHANYFKCVPGGISIRAETLSLVLQDMCDAYLQHGLHKILILNGHGGNFAWVREVTEQIYAQQGTIIPSINLWGNIPKQVWQEAFPEHGEQLAGHGAEPIGSLNAYVFPESIRQHAICGWDGNQKHKGMEMSGVSVAYFKGLTIQLPLNINDVNSTGVNKGQGTRHSNAKSGEIIFNRMSTLLQEFITMYWFSEDEIAIAD